MDERFCSALGEAAAALRPPARLWVRRVRAEAAGQPLARRLAARVLFEGRHVGGRRCGRRSHGFLLRGSLGQEPLHFGLERFDVVWARLGLLGSMRCFK